MLVILDRGHGDKGAGKIDPGATFGGYCEIDFAAAYMKAARIELENRGHVVLVCPEGSYDSRHRWAIAEAAKRPTMDALYAQLHVNAGGGTYGLVEYDERSSWGRQAAEILAHELVGVSAGRTNALDSTERGWVCIDDIYASPTMCGLIYEPFFIDSAAHAPLRTPDGLRRVGLALADGIDRYAKACAARRAA